MEAVVEYDAPTATDFFTPVTINCESDTAALESGDTFPLGTTTITCTMLPMLMASSLSHSRLQ